MPGAGTRLKRTAVAVGTGSTSRASRLRTQKSVLNAEARTAAVHAPRSIVSRRGGECLRSPVDDAASIERSWNRRSLC